MPNDKCFAERLKRIRKACGLTQKQLGEMLGLDATSIAKYETAVAEPKRDTLCRMADIFQVPLVTLMTGQHPIPTLCDNQPTFEQSIVNRFSHLTQEEQLLIAQFRQLTDEQQTAILQDIRLFFE